jgi:hypothetical protein
MTVEGSRCGARWAGVIAVKEKEEEEEEEGGIQKYISLGMLQIVTLRCFNC